MKPHRIRTAVFALLLASVPTGVLVSACSKPEPPPPGPLASDDDNKAKTKKKKSSSDDDDPKPVPGGDDTTGTGDAASPKYVGPAGSGKSKSDADKAKLIACCTALRNAAAAAGLANTAASTVLPPGLPTPPPPPPKAELDKQVAACDKAVAGWTGDLNTSLKNVKNASTIALPGACSM